MSSGPSSLRLLAQLPSVWYPFPSRYSPPCDGKMAARSPHPHPLMPACPQNLRERVTFPSKCDHPFLDQSLGTGKWDFSVGKTWVMSSHLEPEMELTPP